MKLNKSAVKTVLATILASSCAVAAADENKEGYSTLNIKGLAVTGSNRVFGEPQFDYGPILKRTGFETLFAYNPGGSEPLALTSDMPDSTIVATGVSQEFLKTFGFSQDSFDPADANLPLRKTKVNVDFAGVERLTLRDMQDAEQTENYQGTPNKPITLGQWMSASGVGTIKCENKNSAKVDLKFKKLIPNGLYSVIGTFETVPILPPITLGGVPNFTVADKNGNAKFKRTINFCPMDVKEGDAKMVNITMTYHSDHTVHGNVVAPLAKGFIAGLTVQEHVQFLVTGELCNGTCIK